MRPTNKSRSRNKNNRRSTLGNVVNRVFESAGPDGKVRGTPQQIIEKYQSLARDAQLSGDRVAAESFQQHAEHYARMLGEAQREMAERQAEQQQRQPDMGGGAQQEAGERSDSTDPYQDRADADWSVRDDSGPGPDERAEARADTGREAQPRATREPKEAMPLVQDSEAAQTGSVGGPGSGLVETPEGKVQRPRRPRQNRQRRAPGDGAAEVTPAAE